MDGGVRVTGVLMHSINKSFLVLADGLDLAEDDPKAAAQLLHVAQLIQLHLVVKALFLHHNVDELLLAIDADAELRVDILLHAKLVR